MIYLHTILFSSYTLNSGPDVTLTVSVLRLYVWPSLHSQVNIFLGHKLIYMGRKEIPLALQVFGNSSIDASIVHFVPCV